MKIIHKFSVRCFLSITILLVTTICIYPSLEDNEPYTEIFVKESDRAYCVMNVKIVYPDLVSELERKKLFFELVDNMNMMEWKFRTIGHIRVPEDDKLELFNVDFDNFDSFSVFLYQYCAKGKESMKQYVFGALEAFNLLKFEEESQELKWTYSFHENSNHVADWNNVKDKSLRGIFSKMQSNFDIEKCFIVYDPKFSTYKGGNINRKWERVRYAMYRTFRKFHFPIQEIYNHDDKIIVLLLHHCDRKKYMRKILEYAMKYYTGVDTSNFNISYQVQDTDWLDDL